MKITQILFLMTCMILSSQTALVADPAPADVTLLQILADPYRHDRKVVRLIGFLHLEKNGHALYLHEEDYKHAITAYSLAVEPTDEMINRMDQLNNRYVVIEGILDMENKGFMEAHSGTLRRIYRCDEWSSAGWPANKKLADGRIDPVAAERP